MLIARACEGHVLFARALVVESLSSSSLYQTSNREREMAYCQGELFMWTMKASETTQREDDVGCHRYHDKTESDHGLLYRDERILYTGEFRRRAYRVLLANTIRMQQQAERFSMVLLKPN